MDLQDLQPPVPVGNPDLDLPVEAAGPAERRVDVLEQVRGADHHDLAPALEAVQEGEELGDEPLLDLAKHVRAPRGDGVDLVEKDDAGGAVLGLVEDLPQPGLTLTVELADHLGAVDVNEVGLRLGGERAGQLGLARAGRPVEEHALRGLDVQPLEEAGVPERPLDDLPDAGQLVVQAAHVPVRDAGRSLGDDLGIDKRDVGGADDPHGAVRNGGGDAEGRDRRVLPRVGEDVPLEDRDAAEGLDQPGRLLRTRPCAGGHQSREPDRHGPRTLDLLEADAVADPHPGVLPPERPEQQDAFANHVGGHEHSDGHGRLPAGQAHRIPGLDPQDLHVGGVQVDHALGVPAHDGVDPPEDRLGGTPLLGCQACCRVHASTTPILRLAQRSQVHVPGAPDVRPGGRFGRVRIADPDRRHDQLVLLVRFLQPAGPLVGDRRELLHVRPECLQHVVQSRAVGDAVDRVVELVVEAAVLVQVGRRLEAAAVHLGQEAVQALHVGRRAPPGGHRSDQPLEGSPDLVDVQDVLARHPAHHEAAARVLLGQALDLEPLQRLPDGRAADPELLGELPLDQALAPRQRAVQDRPAEH